MNAVRFCCVVLLVGCLAFFSAWQQVQTYRLGYDLERLNREKESLLRERERLRVDAGRLRSPDALESAAKELSVSVGPPDRFPVAWVAFSAPAPRAEPRLAKALPTPRR